MEWNWTPLSPLQMQHYRDLCPDFEYRVFPLQDDLPGISTGLSNKCTTVMIAASGDSSGRVFYMANLLRPDPKDRKGPAIDQMPFGFVFDSSSPLLSGALVQHGEWDGRTSYPPASAWTNIVNGDYEAYASLSLVPTASAGPISALEGGSHVGAFTTLIEKLSQLAKDGSEAKTTEPATKSPTEVI